ncbi:heavy metal translocating P-type ATPase [Legionella clemsonensis]|uniref:Silver exporting P-type ATPase n=1 Tax=Legionella clemsonensis TaxID=1867846 RepID=A0A222P4V2_9GAMM|nr:HAD-IC family P-type ATPase [Legionella clemsonensis]ASQ46878.1 Silver exporting P-type ATPase [Legionella clemsonensis]
MFDIYEFDVPSATCESCIASILHPLQQEEFKRNSGIIVEAHQFNRLKRTLKLQIKRSNKKREEITDLLKKEITEAGFPCIPIPSKTALPQALPKMSWYKQLLTSNWFLGGLGTGSGIILLILSTVFTGGLPLIAMIGIGTFSTALTLTLGAPFYYQAANNLFRAKNLTMDTLFTVSTLTVVTVSLLSFALPWLPMMFEAGLLIFGFRYLGLAIEETITQSIGAEKNFTDRLPDKVKLVAEENASELIAIRAGEELELAAGDIIPVDGECLTSGFVYDTIITGAPLPRVVKAGEKVLAGMRLAENASPMKIKATPIIIDLEEGETVPVDGFCENDCFIEDEETKNARKVCEGEPLFAGTRLNSAAKLKVTAVATYTYLHRLDRNNERAQFEKAPIQETTARVLQYFVPAVIFLAMFCGVIISFFFPLTSALQSAISVLVSACPCTLGLITPLAVKIGINKAAEHGVQFKSARELEAADSVNAIVFDIHGTLTKGIPEVTDYRYDPRLSSKKEVFSYFAALEKNSRHPIAKAIVSYVNNEEIEQYTANELDNSNHSGIKAKIIRQVNTEDAMEEVIIGNQTIMEENGIDVSTQQEYLPGNGGQSVIYLARNKQILGCMLLSDPLREHAKETIAALTQMGKKIFICTGADKNTARRITALLNIPFENVAYGCVGISENSQDNSKIAFIKKLEAEGYHVAMVGDAANDSAAVARSFGIAIKSQVADEITQQQASAVIHGNSLKPIVNVFTVARQTVANIRQNLGFSLVYNMASMLLTGGLLVALGFTINPAVGVVLMILQTSLILMNAYRFKIQSLEQSTQEKVVMNNVECSESYGCFNRLFGRKPEVQSAYTLQTEQNNRLPFSKVLSKTIEDDEVKLSQRFTISGLQ